MCPTVAHRSYHRFKPFQAKLFISLVARFDYPVGIEHENIVRLELHYRFRIPRCLKDTERHSALRQEFAGAVFPKQKRRVVAGAYVKKTFVFRIDQTVEACNEALAVGGVMYKAINSTYHYSHRQFVDHRRVKVSSERNHNQRSR